MALVSSVFEQSAQGQDGRRLTVERHTDSTGMTYLFQYRCRDTMDPQAIIGARAVRLAEELAQAEFEAALFTSAAPTPLLWQTATQFGVRLRAKYLASSGDGCAYLARWLLRQISDGHYTDTQVRNIFSLTAGQWTTLKAKMQTVADSLLIVESAMGE
jgi:hypothetical protein